MPPVVSLRVTPGVDLAMERDAVIQLETLAETGAVPLDFHAPKPASFLRVTL